MISGTKRSELLDGIRGLSVIFVVLFHFYPEIFPGGYSGVDVFFLISGYLITKSIFRSFESDKYSLIVFYSSRITRIYPVLLTVIFTTFMFGWFVLENHEFKLLAKHATYSITQIINFVLWSEGGYFDVASELKVFLHMWSLSVEWQIYLIAPLVIALLLNLAKSTSILTQTIFIGSIICMLFFIYAGHRYPTHTYYFTPLRSWAYFLGTGIYLYHRDIIFNESIATKEFLISKFNPHSTSLITFLAVTVVLIVNLIFLPEYLNYSLISVISVLTLCVLILIKPKIPINIPALLFSKIVIYLGVISFSLYLWHWPVLYFIRILNWNVSNLYLFYGIVFSIFLSSISYTYIERPFNNSQNKKKSAVKLLVTASIVCGFCIPVILSEGFPERYLSKIESNYEPVNPIRYKTIHTCDPIDDVQDSWCRTTNKPRVLLLGDSHAHLLLKALVESNHQIFSNVYNMGAGNCHPAFTLPKDARCSRQINQSFKRLKNMPNFEYSIVTAWNSVVTDDDFDNFFNGYSELLLRLQNQSKNVIFIIDNPTLKKNIYSCRSYLSNFKLRKSLSNTDKNCFGTQQEDFIRNPSYEKLVELLRKKFKKIKFINPFTDICPNMKCPLIQEGVLIYSDEGHLSYNASKVVVRHILELSK